MTQHQTHVTTIEIEGMTIAIRAWYCTPAQGWFWSAAAQDPDVDWATRSLNHAWPSAAAATEVATAALTRLFA